MLARTATVAVPRAAAKALQYLTIAVLQARMCFARLGAFTPATSAAGSCFCGRCALTWRCATLEVQASQSPCKDAVPRWLQFFHRNCGLTHLMFCRLQAILTFALVSGCILLRDAGCASGAQLIYTVLHAPAVRPGQQAGWPVSIPTVPASTPENCDYPAVRQRPTWCMATSGRLAVALQTASRAAHCRRLGPDEACLLCNIQRPGACRRRCTWRMR